MSAQHTPGPLKCGKSLGDDGLQFTIESDWSTTEGEWNDRYVSFSGYFGSYGPHLFAAAPELLEALELILAITDRDHVAWDKARAAITKVKGVAQWL